MAIFPFSTRTILEQNDPQVEYKLYARTRFEESSAWERIPLEPGWSLEENANAASVLKLNPINLTWLFSNEANRANRMQLGAQIKLVVIVGGVEEARFIGELNGEDPSTDDFSIEVYDDFAKWNTTSSALSLEATRLELPASCNLALIEKPGYNAVYGIEAVAANADAFYGGDYTTPTPRRPWAMSSVIVRDADGNAISSDVCRIIAELGYIQVTQDGIEPVSIEGVEVYLESTLDLGDLVKAILSHPNATGRLQGLGYDSSSWTIQRTCASGCTTTVLKLAEGARHLYPYHKVTVNSETRRVVSRSLSAGTITLESALSSAPASGAAVSYDTLDVGIDAQEAKWDYGDGSNMDFWQRLMKDVGYTVLLRYNPAENVYELLRWQMSAAAEYNLAAQNRVMSIQPRSLADLYTCYVGTGELEKPANLCTLSSLTHVLGMPADLDGGFEYPPPGYSYPGAPFSPNQQLKAYLYGVPVYWDSGYDPDTGSASDPCGLARWFDGDANTTVGWHQNYDRTQWYKLCQFWFHATKTIRRFILCAANSQKPELPYTYTVEVSVSGTPGSWKALSPALKNRSLKPLEVVDVSEAEISNAQAQYLRVLAKPEKDGATNLGDPFLGVSIIAAYERTNYTAVAQIQGTDPDEVFRVSVPWPPYYKDISTYYPALLQRFGNQQRSAPPEKLGNVLNKVKAKELMLIKLDSGIRLYQKVKYTHTCDPYARIGDCPLAVDELNGSVPIFIEHVSLTDAETVIEGVNYNAVVLP
jgi:hypothetical protein